MFDPDMLTDFQRTPVLAPAPVKASSHASPWPALALIVGIWIGIGVEHYLRHPPQAPCVDDISDNLRASILK